MAPERCPVLQDLQGITTVKVSPFAAIPTTIFHTGAPSLIKYFTEDSHKESKGINVDHGDGTSH